MTSTHVTWPPLLVLGSRRSGAGLVARILEQSGLSIDRPSAAATTETARLREEWVRVDEAARERFRASVIGAEGQPPGWDDLLARGRRCLEAAPIAGPWGLHELVSLEASAFWLRACPRARWVLCLRHPLEVAWSTRAAAPHLSLEATVESWQRAHVDLRELPPEAGLVCHFEALLYDPPAELARLAAFVGLVPDPERDAAAAALVVSGRRRYVAPSSAGLPPHVLATYEHWREKAGPVEAESRRDLEFHARQAAQALVAAQDEASHLRAENARLAEAALRSSSALAAADALATTALGHRRAPWLLRAALAQRSWRDRVLPRGSHRRAVVRRLRLALSPAQTLAPPVEGRDSSGVQDRLAVLAYERHRRWTEPPATEAAGAQSQRPTLVACSAFAADAPRVRRTGDSLLAQTHPALEWRLHAPSADADLLGVVTQLGEAGLRVRLVDSPSAFASAHDEAVVLVEPGDQLAPWALAQLARALREEPRPDVVYGDLDHVDAEGERGDPWFKPDWSPELLYSADLLAGATAFAPSLVAHALSETPVEAAAWRRVLGLRAAEKATRVAHVSHVLCHQPASPQEQADAPVVEALCSTLRRQGRIAAAVTRAACGELRVRWRSSTEPLVSIVIPSRDQAELLERCLDGLFFRTSYPHCEVVLVDTGSVEPAASELYERHRDRPGFRVVPWSGAFNFGAACNRGARAARGDALLFLNNDTQVLDDDWLDRLVQWLDVPAVAGVGAKLLFPSGRLQHAGVIVGMGGIASHVFHGQPEHSNGPFGPDCWYRNLSALTAACLLVRRADFEQVSGFDEAYQLAYSDVDLCLRLRERGRRLVYTPDARLVHHESVSRGRRVHRRDYELISQYLAAHELLRGDPHFNPHLTYGSVVPVLAMDAAATPARLNREVMTWLPQRETFHVPDDLG